MTLTSLDDACRFLFPRNAGRIKWGLDVIETLLEALGHPEAMWRSVHVGGTNGKGSVSGIMAQAIRGRGWRVGLYTSPHLVRVSERIRVDGVPIGDDAFVQWTERLRPTIEASGASFFEALTAIAFADFAARQVDLAVVEVGLGGRLDSTNVVTPLTTVVTGVGLEHREYLGDDIHQIAREKAGIAKPGAPFVTTEPDPAVRATLLEEAARRGAQIVETPVAEMMDDARRILGETVWTSLIPYRKRNAACAIAAAATLPEAFRPSDEELAAGVAHGIPPGRFDRRGKWLLDCAHNPHGMAALVEAITFARPPAPIHAVVGIAGDKEWREMLTQLVGVVDRVILSRPPSIPEERRLPDDPSGTDAWPSLRVVADFDTALQEAAVGAGTVLVTGSLYTVGDAMARLPPFLSDG